MPEEKSDRAKWPRAQAQELANRLCHVLEKDTVKIIVSGSLRREKPEVHDIEILYVSKRHEQPDPNDMFARVMVDLADATIARLMRQGVLRPRLNVNGHTTMGDKNKLMVHVPSGILVDFFKTSLENWWVSLVIRTGSKANNLRLTNGAIRLGRTLNAYGSGVTDGDRIIPAHSEEDVFRLCGLPYQTPVKRV